MANPFVKGWKYLMALFGAKIDEYADPKVQIQQAIEEAQRQHQTLVQQAAAVIGNQRQLEMKLSRQLTEVENLQANARQALLLGDRARAEGDPARADEFEHTAQTFATQLVSAESAMEDLKSLHDQALAAAAQARKAVDSNAMLLRQRLAERTKLLSQLEQAKMQETVARSLESIGSLSAPGTTPSLDEVRDKIERRYAVALGRADLAQSTVEGRRLEVLKATLDLAGTTRLAEIRASLTRSTAGAGQAAAVDAQPGRAAVDAQPPRPAVEGEPARPALGADTPPKQLETPAGREPAHEPDAG
jgi:phage shock protein A